MSQEQPLIDIELINNMLYGDEAYVKEFASASIQSFSEFKTKFRQDVLNRDMDELRRAGHKIKPVASMLHLDPILEMYEKSKKLLEQNAPKDDLEQIVNEMDDFCQRVLNEFEAIK